MSSLIETIKYRGYDIECYYDEDSQSPDEWGNDDAFVVYDHRDFCIKRDGFDPVVIFEHIEQTKRAYYDGHFVSPLYAYIHSGVALSLGRNAYPFDCRWDTSYRGFVLVKRSKYYWTRKKAIELAQAIVDEWNEYLSGDVYGYNSEVGSYWGYYGREGYKQMIDDAKSEIDYHCAKQLREHVNKLKTWIRNHVPLEKRQPAPQFI